MTQEVQEKYFTPNEQKACHNYSIEAAGPWYDVEDYHQERVFIQECKWIPLPLRTYFIGDSLLAPLVP